MSRRGLSLLEVVLAVGLVAVAILAMVGVFVTGLRLMARSRETSEGTEVAREVLERIQEGTYVPNVSRVYDGAVPDAPDAGFPPAPYPSIQVGAVTYTLVVTTEPVAGTSDVTSVLVEARWEGDKRARLQCYFYGKN